MEKLDIYVACFHVTTEKSALLFQCEIQVRELYLSYFPCPVDLTLQPKNLRCYSNVKFRCILVVWYFGKYGYLCLYIAACALN